VPTPPTTAPIAAKQRVHEFAKHSMRVPSSPGKAKVDDIMASQDRALLPYHTHCRIAAGWQAAGIWQISAGNLAGFCR
jgi:putative hemolysin